MSYSALDPRLIREQHRLLRGEPDDDVIFAVSSQDTRLLPTLVAVAAVLALLCAGTAGWMLWVQSVAPPLVAQLTITSPTAAQPPAVPPAVLDIAIETADEATIRQTVVDHVAAYRFADNPNIIVLDFPALSRQGAMLNRVASLIEKSGLPRDRVLTDKELESAIREHGDTAETYSYGHDYRADELAYFFATADRQHVMLNAAETWLRGLLQQLGWFAPGATGALISVPGTNIAITDATRATMLHRELALGEFFSNPAYASYVRGFWLNTMTEDERDGVRQFLDSMDDDINDEELMYNEMQAYLMFTHDPRFFLPANVNMSTVRLLQLQDAFLQALPKSWLKAALSQHLQQVRQAQR